MGQQNTVQPPIDITKSVPEDQKYLVKEAGQGGAVLGFVMGGPIGSAVLGFGSAYAVRKQDCAMGEAARSLGKLTLSVKEKASTVEDKHHFLKKSKMAIDNFCGDNDSTTKENGGKATTNIASKARSSAVSTWNAASKFTEENQLFERGVEGTGKGIEYVGDAISKLQRSKKSTQQHQHQQSGIVH